MAFRGTFDHTLDAKNRLTVPARFRAALANGVVLAKSVEPCVEVWTPEDFEGFTKETLHAGRSRLDPETRAARRWFSANSLDTELDSAGRIGVPAWLLEHAGLKRDVVVAGSDDCFELWDRAAWAEYDARVGPTIPSIAESLGRPD